MRSINLHFTYLLEDKDTSRTKFDGLDLEASWPWPRCGPALSLAVALKAAGLGLVLEMPFATKYYIVFLTLTPQCCTAFLPTLYELY